MDAIVIAIPEIMLALVGTNGASITCFFAFMCKEQLRANEARQIIIL